MEISATLSQIAVGSHRRDAYRSRVLYSRGRAARAIKTKRASYIASFKKVAGLPVHVTDQFTEPVFPFNVRLRLYPLISVAHHGDQQINQHHYRDQHVYAEGQLEEDRGPLRLIELDPQLVVGSLAEDGEEQIFEGNHRIHLYWNYEAHTTHTHTQDVSWLLY